MKFFDLSNGISTGIKRFFSLIISAVLAVSFSACEDSGTGGANTDGPVSQTQSESTSAENNTQGENDVNSDSESGGSNILIAYFTAAKNSGVDAVSSASYSTVNGEAVGRLRAIANMIQTKTGGELFSIQTSVVYPADGGELIEYAADEQAKRAYLRIIWTILFVLIFPTTIILTAAAFTIITAEGTLYLIMMIF